MTPEEAKKYINAHTWSESRLGLGRTQELLSLLGNPEKNLRFIHIAGTNGKGSTAAMIAAILCATGLRTGLYTSPYVVDFNERIQVDGEMISDDDLAVITERVAKAADMMEDHPSQFEMITAIGMLYFLYRSCDTVVLEVGMGGRLDSTNVIETPLAAVITRIGLDHTEYLGDTIEKIAYEKAGIIKPGGDVVAYANDNAVMTVLRSVCEERGAVLYEAEEVTALAHSLSGQSFSYHGENYELSLLGANQLKNAALCLKVIEVLKRKGIEISNEAIRTGLKNVCWIARFELISEDPVIIVDGGHNPQCAEALAENIRLYLGEEKVRFIIGMLKDKDVNGVIDILSPYAAGFITLKPDSPRALTSQELADLIGDNAIAATSIDEAFRIALSHPEPIIVFGSLYLAGDILRGSGPRKT